MSSDYYPTSENHEHANQLLKKLFINYSPLCCSKPVRPLFIFRTQIKIFWWNPRAFWLCIDSNTTDTFKTQKGSKDIVKIVHVTSVVQP